MGDSVSQLVIELTRDREVDPILGEHSAWLGLSATAAHSAGDRTNAQRRMTIEIHPDDTGDDGLVGAVATLRERGYGVAVDASAANGSRSRC